MSSLRPDLHELPARVAFAVTDAQYAKLSDRWQYRALQQRCFVEALAEKAPECEPFDCCDETLGSLEVWDDPPARCVRFMWRRKPQSMAPVPPSRVRILSEAPLVPLAPLDEATTPPQGE